MFTFGGQFTHVSLDKFFRRCSTAQLFFTNTAGTGLPISRTSCWQPEFSFGGGGVYNHEYRQNNFGGLRARRLEGYVKSDAEPGLAHRISGRMDRWRLPHRQYRSDLTKSGTFPFIYPSCVNKLGVTGLTGNAAGSTFNNNVVDRLGTARWLGLGCVGTPHHDDARRLRHLLRARRRGRGRSAELPVAVHSHRVLRTDARDSRMSNFFTGTPASESERGAASRQLSGAWLPCLAQLTSFLPEQPNRAANYGRACTGGPGVNSTQNLFVLEVPRHFVVPNTQQWNLTVQRELGKTLGAGSRIRRHARNSSCARRAMRSNR